MAAELETLRTMATVTGCQRRHDGPDARQPSRPPTCAWSCSSDTGEIAQWWSKNLGAVDDTAAELRRKNTVLDEEKAARQLANRAAVSNSVAIAQGLPSTAPTPTGGRTMAGINDSALWQREWLPPIAMASKLRCTALKRQTDQRLETRANSQVGQRDGAHGSSLVDDRVRSDAARPDPREEGIRPRIVA